MSPAHGRGCNCWFPMPFEQAKIGVSNGGTTEAGVFYIDYEKTDDVAGYGRLHAQWRRENPATGLASIFRAR